MSAQGLFQGMAVVIDDELSNAESEIVKIIESIKEHGGHVIGMDALPAVDADYQNFGGAAFFIMDWQLHGKLLVDADSGISIKIPPLLEKKHLQEKVDFLTNLKKSRLAPVFIFTNDDTDVVKDALHKYADLYQKDQPSHIFVCSKDEVLKKGVFVVLNDWLQATPSVLVLKTWEQEYERAKNSMFAEFYSRSIYWPALLWKTFDDDGIPASDELGRVITRNLFSRMTPFHLDLSGFSEIMEQHQKSNPTEYQQTLLKVLEGERFVRKDGLHDDSIAPGDVYKYSGNYWINIRPDCDCVVRGDMGDVDLYLLKGSKVSNKEIEKSLNVERGNFSEREDEVIVFAMYDGVSVSFKLKEIHTNQWSKIKGKRIGRLLAPFLTRVQQRYSGYLQRPGLPKIPKAAMPAAIVLAAEAAQRKIDEKEVLEEIKETVPGQPSATPIILSPQAQEDVLVAESVNSSGAADVLNASESMAGAPVHEEASRNDPKPG